MLYFANDIMILMIELNAFKIGGCYLIMIYFELFSRDEIVI